MILRIELLAKATTNLMRLYSPEPLVNFAELRYFYRRDANSIQEEKLHYSPSFIISKTKIKNLNSIFLVKTPNQRSYSAT
jgi:hypothetical protein